MFENTNTATTDAKSMQKMTDKNNKRVFFRKRRGCPLSVQGAPAIDYKNPTLLLKFVSDGGRMLPGRITNVCPKKQRELKKAIKAARHLALLPFVFQVK